MVATRLALLAARSESLQKLVRLLALLWPLYEVGCGIASRTVEELDDEARAGAPALHGGRSNGGRAGGTGGAIAVGGNPSGPTPLGGMPGDGPIAASGGMLGSAASPTGGMLGAGGRATLQQYESELLAEHQRAPRTLAVDATHAYWVNHDGASVMRVALAGGMPEVLADEQLYPHAVAIGGQSVYFTTDYDVRRVPLAGGQVQVLAEELRPSVIAVDESHVYWASSASGAGVRRMPLAGGEPVTFATEDEAADLLLDTDNAYWTTASAVKKQSKSGSVAVVLADTSASRGAALSGDYLYWVHDSVVERVTKDGLKREKVVDTGPLPQGVAADATTVYFATGYGQVMRAALNEPKPYVVASNQNGPWVAASDASFVYWIEAASSEARIQRFAK